MITFLIFTGANKCRVLIQGIEGPRETPVQWLSEHLSHPDNFMHICVVKRPSSDNELQTVYAMLLNMALVHLYQGPAQNSSRMVKCATSQSHLDNFMHLFVVKRPPVDNELQTVYAMLLNLAPVHLYQGPAQNSSAMNKCATSKTSRQFHAHDLCVVKIPPADNVLQTVFAMLLNIWHWYIFQGPSVKLQCNGYSMLVISCTYVSSKDHMPITSCRLVFATVLNLARVVHLLSLIVV